MVNGSIVLACFLFPEYSMGSVCALVLPLVLPLWLSRPCFPPLTAPHYFSSTAPQSLVSHHSLALSQCAMPTSFHADAITDTFLQRNANIVFADTFAKIVNICLFLTLGVFLRNFVHDVDLGYLILFAHTLNIWSAVYRERKRFDSRAVLATLLLQSAD